MVGMAGLWPLLVALFSCVFSPGTQVTVQIAACCELWTSVLLCEVAAFHPAFLGLGRKGGSVLGALSRAFAAT